MEVTPQTYSKTNEITMKTDYTKGYEQATLDIQADVYRVIEAETNGHGMIPAKRLKSELSIEAFPSLPTKA